MGAHSPAREQQGADVMTQWRTSRNTQVGEAVSLSSTGENRTVAFTWPQGEAPRPRDTQTDIAHEKPSPLGLPFRQPESQPPSSTAPSSMPPASPGASGTFPSTPGNKAWGTAWSMNARQKGQTIGQYLHVHQQTSAQNEAQPALLVPPPLEAEPVARGAVEASDAAADPLGQHPSERPQSQVAPSAEIPDLLWFDPKSMQRVRVWHQELLSRQKVIAFDERAALCAESPQDFKLRTEVLAVLTQSAIEHEDVGHLVNDGLSPSGHYVAPLVTLEGWLSFSFNETDELRALLAQAEGQRGQHAELGQALDSAHKLLEGPATARALAKATRLVRAKLRSAIGTDAARRLAEDVEALLLDQRSYRKRTFLGSEWLRTALVRDSGETVAYLPATLALELPLYAVMRCRVIGEVIPPQDHYESGAFALRTIALARLLKPSAFARHEG
jgi:hypothetical protein